MDKKKVMSNVHVASVPIIVGNDYIKVVDDCIYLWKTYASTNYDESFKTENNYN